MVDLFFHLDASLFLFINRTLANPVFDAVMPVITDVDNWRIPIVAMWLSLLVFGGKKGRITAVFVILILTLSDQLSSALIKPMVGRVRPCFVLENVHQLIRQSRSPSFPSSHAANITAMATLFSYQYSRYKWIFAGIAVLISYSRIAVGVHYPSDVIAGALLGFLCACMVLYTGRRLIPWFENRKAVKKESG